MKKILLLLLMLMISAAAVSAQTSSAVKLFLDKYEPSPVEPGDVVSVSVKVQNTAQGILKDGSLEVEPQFPFSAAGSVVEKLGDVGASPIVKTFRLKVAENAVLGDNPIKFRFISGASGVEESFDISVKLRNPVITISSISIKPSPVKPGDTATVEIEVSNIAESVLKDVGIKLKLEKETLTTTTTVTSIDLPFAPVGSATEKKIERLNPGSSYTFRFNLQAYPDAEAKLYKVPATLTYFDELGNEYSKDDILGIPVNARPSYALNLESTDIYSSRTNGNVVISVSNPGPTNMKFVTMQLLPSDGYKVVDSPTTYIGNIEPDGFETAEFKIFVDAKPGEVPLKVILTYKDDYNNELIDNKEITLPVYSAGEAGNYGLLPKQNALTQVFSVLVLVIVAVFVVFMLLDLQSLRQARPRKILWAVLILTGIGAVLYWFIGRRRH